MHQESYVIVTAAKNEASFLELTIDAVVRQRLLPKAWVIVSDNSTDDTDAIVQSRAGKCSFLRLIRKTSKTNRDFSSKVDAIRIGVESLVDIPYRYLAILDADISIPEDYYKNIIELMTENKEIGIAGGVLFESSGNRIEERISSRWSVSGAIQVYRRACYEDIGGLVPLSGGGEDTVAEIMAGMKGWKVRSFPAIKGCHNRMTGTAGNEKILMIKYNFGRRDYSYGTHPLYEILKCIRRIKERPIFLSSAMRFIGFIAMHLKKEPRILPEVIVAHVRREQINRIKRILVSRSLKELD